jgi:TolA-binding protein
VRPIASVLLLTTGACAHYAQQDGERLQAEVYALSTRLEAIESKVDGLAEVQARHVETLGRLVVEVGDLNLAARRNDADFGVQVEDILQKLARLEGSAVLLDERVSTLESATTATREEFDLKLENLADGDAKPTPESSELSLDDPEAALDEAARRIDRGDPASARRLIRALTLKNDKNRAFRRYRPRAQFLIAESYFAGGDYQQAAAEYNKVRKSYPKAAEVPQAYLKLGQCFERLGLPADAKLFYQTLAKQFPRSSAASEARKRLKKL